MLRPLKREVREPVVDQIDQHVAVIDTTTAVDELTRIAHDRVDSSSTQQLRDKQEFWIEILLCRCLVHYCDNAERRVAALGSPLLAKSIEERAFCDDANWCCSENRLLVTAELLKATGDSIQEGTARIRVDLDQPRSRGRQMKVVTQNASA